MSSKGLGFPLIDKSESKFSRNKIRNGDHLYTSETENYSRNKKPPISYFLRERDSVSEEYLEQKVKYYTTTKSTQMNYIKYKLLNGGFQRGDLHILDQKDLDICIDVQNQMKAKRLNKGRNANSANQIASKDFISKSAKFQSNI